MSMALTLPAQFIAGTTTKGSAPRKPMNEAQFEAFYRKTAGSLWSYLYRLVGNAATADDLLQKTFFRFLRRKPNPAGAEHMRRYIFRPATTLALDHFRESRREKEKSLEPAPAVVHDERHELRHDMMRMFGELKPRERALLWLAHVEGADHDEIGEALGVGSKSVRVLLFRARKRLAEILTRNGMAPESSR